MKYLKIFILILGIYFISNCSGLHKVQNQESSSASVYHAVQLFRYPAPNYSWPLPLFVPNSYHNVNNDNINAPNADDSGLDKTECGNDCRRGDDTKNSHQLGFDISDSDRDVLPTNYGKIPIDEFLYSDDDDNPVSDENSDRKKNGKHIPIDEFLFYNDDDDDDDDENDDSYEGEIDDFGNPINCQCGCSKQNDNYEEVSEDEEDEYEYDDSDEDIAENIDEDNDGKWSTRLRHIKTRIAKELFNMLRAN